jgi:hypothetical protein
MYEFKLILNLFTQCYTPVPKAQRTVINSGPLNCFQNKVVIKTLGRSRNLNLLQFDPKVSLLALTFNQYFFRHINLSESRMFKIYLILNLPHLSVNLKGLDYTLSTCGAQNHLVVEPSSLT